MPLNKSLFNPRLYARIHELWFGGMPATATVPTEALQQRWFPRDPAVKEAFDAECRAHLAEALEAIRPGSASIEELQSDLAAELQSCSDDQSRSSTALSLVILLDQIPRNLYRTPAALPLVYSHYDELSRSLVANILARDPRPDMHASIRYAPVKRIWFAMPLMHSEDKLMHKRSSEYWDECVADVRERGDADAEQFLERMRGFEQMHKEIVDRFGRYPYRNKFLGRQSTEEEEAWIKEGGNTFGVGG